MQEITFSSNEIQQNSLSLYQQIVDLEKQLLDSKLSEAKKSELRAQILELQLQVGESESLEYTENPTFVGLAVPTSEVQDILSKSKVKSDKNLQPIVEKLPKINKAEQQAAQKRIEKVLDPEAETNLEIMAAERRREFGGQLYEFMKNGVNNISLPPKELTQEFLEAKTLSEFRALNSLQHGIKSTIESYQNTRALEKDSKKFLGVSIGLEANLSAARTISKGFFTAVNAIKDKAVGAVKESNFVNQGVDAVRDFASAKLGLAEREEDKIIDTTGYGIMQKLNKALAQKLPGQFGKDIADPSKVPSYAEIGSQSLSNIDAVFARKEAEMIAAVDKKLDKETRDKCVLQIRLYTLLEKEDLIKQVKAKVEAAEFLSREPSYTGSLSSLIENANASRMASGAINMVTSAGMLVAGPIGVVPSILGRITASQLQANYAEMVTILKKEGSKFGKSLIDKDGNGTLSIIKSTLSLIQQGQASISEEQFANLVTQLKVIKAENIVENNIYGAKVTEEIESILEILTEIEIKGVFGEKNHDLEIATTSITNSKQTLNQLTQAYTTVSNPNASPAEKKQAQIIIDEFYDKAQKQANESTYEIPLGGVDPDTGEPRILKLNKMQVRWMITLFGSSVAFIRQINRLQEAADKMGVSLSLNTLEDVQKAIAFTAEEAGRNVTKTAENIGKLGGFVGEKIIDIPTGIAEAGKEVAATTEGFVDSILEDGIGEVAGRALDNFKGMTAETFANILNSSTWSYLQEKGIPVKEINQKLREILAQLFPSHRAAVNSITLNSLDGKPIHGLVVSNHIPEEMMSFYEAKGFKVVDSSSSSLVLVQESEVANISQDPTQILENLKPSDIASNLPEINPVAIKGIEVYDSHISIPIPKDQISDDISVANIEGFGILGNRTSGQFVKLDGKIYAVDRVVFNPVTGDHRLILSVSDLTPEQKLQIDLMLKEQMGDVQERLWSSTLQQPRAVAQYSLINTIDTNFGPGFHAEKVTEIQKTNLGKELTNHNIYRLFTQSDTNSLEKTKLLNKVAGALNSYSTKDAEGNTVMSFEDAQKLLQRLNRYPTDLIADGTKIDPRGTLATEDLLKDNMRNILSKMQPGGKLIIMDKGSSGFDLYVTFDQNNTQYLVSPKLPNLTDVKAATSPISDIQGAYEATVFNSENFKTANELYTNLADEILKRERLTTGNISLTASVNYGGTNLTDEQYDKAKLELAEIFRKHVERNGYTPEGFLLATQSGGKVMITNTEIVSDIDKWIKTKPLGFDMDEGPFERKLRAAFGGNQTASELSSLSQNLETIRKTSGWDGKGDVIGLGDEVLGVKTLNPLAADPEGISRLDYAIRRNPTMPPENYVRMAELHHKFLFGKNALINGETVPGNLNVGIDETIKLDNEIQAIAAKYNSPDFFRNASNLGGEQGVLKAITLENPEAKINRHIDHLKNTYNLTSQDAALLEAQIKASPVVQQAQFAMNAGKVLAAFLGVAAVGTFGMAVRAKMEAAFLAKMKAQELQMNGKVATKEDLAEIKKLSSEQEIWQMAGQAATTLLITGLNPLAGVALAAAVYGPRFGLGAAAEAELKRRYTKEDRLFEDDGGTAVSGPDGLRDPNKPFFIKSYDEDITPDSATWKNLGLGPLISRLPTGMLEFLVNSSRATEILAGVNPDANLQQKQAVMNNIVAAKGLTDKRRDLIKNNYEATADADMADRKEELRGQNAQMKERTEHEIALQKDFLDKKEQMVKQARIQYGEIVTLLRNYGITVDDLKSIQLGEHPKKDPGYIDVSDIAKVLGIYETDEEGKITSNQPLDGIDLIEFLNQLTASSTLQTSIDAHLVNTIPSGSDKTKMIKNPAGGSADQDQKFNVRFFVQVDDEKFCNLPNLADLRLVLEGLKSNRIRKTNGIDLITGNQALEYVENENFNFNGTRTSSISPEIEARYPVVKKPEREVPETPDTAKEPARPRPTAAAASLETTSEELAALNNTPRGLQDLDNRLDNLLADPGASRSQIQSLILDIQQNYHTRSDRAKDSFLGDQNFANSVDSGRLDRILKIQQLQQKAGINPQITEFDLADVSFVLNNPKLITPQNQKQVAEFVTNFRNSLKLDLTQSLTSNSSDPKLLRQKLSLAMEINSQSSYFDPELDTVIRDLITTNKSTNIDRLEQLKNLRLQAQQQNQLRLIQDKVETDLRLLFASSNGTVSQEYLNKYIQNLAEKNNFGPLQKSLIQNHINQFLQNYNKLQEFKAKNPDIQAFLERIYPDQKFKARELTAKESEIVNYYPDKLMVLIDGNPEFMQGHSAIVERSTGAILIDLEQFNKLSPNAKDDLIRHEISHTAESVQQSIVNATQELPNEDNEAFLTAVGNEIIGNLQQFSGLNNLKLLKARIARYQFDTENSLKQSGFAKNDSYNQAKQRFDVMLNRAFEVIQNMQKRGLSSQQIANLLRNQPTVAWSKIFDRMFNIS